MNAVTQAASDAAIAFLRRSDVPVSVKMTLGYDCTSLVQAFAVIEAEAYARGKAERVEAAALSVEADTIAASHVKKRIATAIRNLGKAPAGEVGS